ncbi:conserved hypothetical protein [Thiomonas sp. X19]|uniref:SHOCT domain-containing protein n=1 Tax=Thiomonas sp. X19 TaxID=1050370 RepID=UPI000B62F66D|nr:SHOCT domain-containing protein [Thiomonas sp. X19]SCC94105.1 conserved hypothetical protein [Thiomonas sp. X19]
MMGFEYGGMGLGWIGMILVWAIPVFLIVGLVRYFMQDRSEPRQRTALKTLDARYARGEIDRDEYVKRRADLTGGA